MRWSAAKSKEVLRKDLSDRRPGFVCGPLAGKVEKKLLRAILAAPQSDVPPHLSVGIGK
jgi:hypothetical protein